MIRRLGFLICLLSISGFAWSCADVVVPTNTDTGAGSDASNIGTDQASPQGPTCPPDSECHCINAGNLDILFGGHTCVDGSCASWNPAVAPTCGENLDCNLLVWAGVCVKEKSIPDCTNELASGTGLTPDCANCTVLAADCSRECQDVPGEEKLSCFAENNCLETAYLCDGLGTRCNTDSDCPSESGKTCHFGFCIFN
ncbi:MAG: hypothetical protein CMH54_01290 [Myxococcales bacterium]|nr:hypothetical protein [Myxococcales bacterium]